MSKEITDEDLNLLDELGVETEPVQSGGLSAREQRIIAGFEEIVRFVEEHGRVPQHGEDRDIFERLYAVRLDCIRSSEECRAILEGRDSHGLLDATACKSSSIVLEDSGAYEATSRSADDLSDDELLAALQDEVMTESDIFELKHVRSREELQAAEEIAKRTPCADFETFRPLFEKIRDELKKGERLTLKFKDNAEINLNDLFILDGHITLVAEMGEEFMNQYDRPDRRLRVIYDNGTESDLLMRSLQRALNRDKASRRITEPDLGPLFSGEQNESDLPSGHIYVLRSKSEHPFVAEHRTVLHKIGVTNGDVSKRISNARKDPTYLLADVEVVASFKLANINRKKLEALLHQFFDTARLDVELKDRFGFEVTPREWFLIPLPIINETIQRIMDGSIGEYRYDVEKASLVKIGIRQ